MLAISPTATSLLATWTRRWQPGARPPAISQRNSLARRDHVPCLRRLTRVNGITENHLATFQQPPRVQPTNLPQLLFDGDIAAFAKELAKPLARPASDRLAAR
jgi:hypothetical protein